MDRINTIAKLPTFVRATPLLVALSIGGACFATPAAADPFLFSTGTPDGKLGALSVPESAGHLETETADDFLLADATTIAQATITGLIPSGTPLSSIANVEVEIYRVFPNDSVQPPSMHVPARANSPADVEIDTATRDGTRGTLTFTVAGLGNTSVLNTVIDGVNQAPQNMTNGEGPVTGEEVQITVTFTPPIVLSADHYYFRPEVDVDGGAFLYLSAPKPIVAPGTPFTGDLQAWIRNTDLKPDWLRIGTDIIGGTTPPTFNMAFSLTGEVGAQADTPTPTATPEPTATATDPPANDSGGGCNMSATRSENPRALAMALFPAAALWWLRRRRI